MTTTSRQVLVHEGARSDIELEEDKDYDVEKED